LGPKTLLTRWRLDGIRVGRSSHTNTVSSVGGRSPQP